MTVLKRDSPARDVLLLDHGLDVAAERPWLSGRRGPRAGSRSTRSIWLQPINLTDPDARLMKTPRDIIRGYNVQAMVSGAETDSEGAGGTAGGWGERIATARPTVGCYAAASYGGRSVCPDAVIVASDQSSASINSSSMSRWSSLVITHDPGIQLPRGGRRCARTHLH